jgi:hypothetical protein
VENEGKKENLLLKQLREYHLQSKWKRKPRGAGGQILAYLIYVIIPSERKTSGFFD